MPDVFLSYSREDQATARRYADALACEGFSVWWDQSLAAGEHYDKVTEQALREAKAVVVLWSRHSVDSRWVRAEATIADRNGTLVPAMIEPCTRPVMFELTQTAELAHWKGDSDDPAWQSFRASVRRFVGAGLPRDALPAAVEASAPRRGHFGRRALAISAVALLLLAGAGYWWSRDRGAVPGSSGGAAAAPIRILVLPFVNQTADPEREYIADGLTRELPAQLQQVKGLNPLGSATSFFYKSSKEDPAGIGRKHGAAWLLTGGVLRHEQGVRVVVELLAAADGSQRWSGSYEGALTDALLQNIATDVAHQLGVLLDVTAPRARGGTNDPKAYDLYLRGEDAIRHGRSEGMQLLSQAVQLDPEFGDALFALSNTEGIAANNALEDTAPQLRAEAQQLAARLEKLPPERQPLEFRFLTLAGHLRWVEAEQLARESLPASAADMGLMMMCVGRYREAVGWFQRSIQDDPVNQAVSLWLIASLTVLGDDAGMRREFERAATLGVNVLRESMEREALLINASSADPAATRAMKEYLSQPGSPWLTLLGPKLEALNDPAVLHAIFRRFVEHPATRSETILNDFTRVAAFFGDRDGALALLRLGWVEQTDRRVEFIWHYPSLRAEPGFKRIIRDLRVYDYWRQTGKWGDFCRPKGADDFECFEKPLIR